MDNGANIRFWAREVLLSQLGLSLVIGVTEDCDRSVHKHLHETFQLTYCFLIFSYFLQMSSSSSSSSSSEPDIGKFIFLSETIDWCTSSPRMTYFCFIFGCSLGLDGLSLGAKNNFESIRDFILFSSNNQVLNTFTDHFYKNYKMSCWKMLFLKYFDIDRDETAEIASVLKQTSLFLFPNEKDALRTLMGDPSKITDVSIRGTLQVKDSTNGAKSYAVITNLVTVNGGMFINIFRLFFDNNIQIALLCFKVNETFPDLNVEVCQKNKRKFRGIFRNLCVRRESDNEMAELNEVIAELLGSNSCGPSLIVANYRGPLPDVRFGPQF